MPQSATRHTNRRASRIKTPEDVVAQWREMLAPAVARIEAKQSVAPRRKGRAGGLQKSANRKGTM
jgi:hypothetical protein